MAWWFLIFAGGAGAALWAGIAAYLRVRRHMNVASTPEAAKKSGVE
jgi:ABC-type uncharacterized transport system permease subunit